MHFKSKLFLFVLFFTTYYNVFSQQDYTSKIKLMILNDTKRDVYLAVKYVVYSEYRLKEEDFEWQTKSWYFIKAGETIYVGDTNNRIFYYYAETTPNFFDQKLYWKGDYYFDDDDLSDDYPMKDYLMSKDDVVYDYNEGTYTFTLRLIK